MRRAWTLLLLPTAIAFADEPNVRALQRAAERAAEVHPDRVRSWERRVRVAALAPSLTVRVGRGGTEVRAETSLDGSERYTINQGDAWRFEVGATWQLDRLVFDREELRLGRESQRLAARRELLLTEVAQLYFERKRLILAFRTHPPADEAARAEASLRIDELTAILDGLTDGALSAGKGE